MGSLFRADRSGDPVNIGDMPISHAELRCLGLLFATLVLASAPVRADAARECRIAPGDPNPVEVGFLDTPDFARGVAVSGSLAFVADGSSGLRVAHAPCPAPAALVDFDETGNAAGNQASGRRPLKLRVDNGTATDLHTS